MRAVALLVLVMLLHAGDLGRPFPDGPAGNCGGMFGIIARNARALGWPDGLVPALNPVPPATLAEALPYTHHPPGLPWLATVAGTASRLPFETGARLAALLLSWAAAVLAASLAAHLAGGPAGWIAGLLMVGLPAGWHHGALVNYETAALPAALWLHLALTRHTVGGGDAGPVARDVTHAAAAGLLAALADWIALLPLLSDLRRARPRRWVAAAAGAAVGVIGASWLYRSVAPSSLGGNLVQALGASPFAADFDLAQWARALGGHLAELYGPGLLGAAAIVVLWRRQTPAARGSLTTLLLLGAVNVTLFARHATGHEHFSLLLLPFVAVGTALALTTLQAQASRPGMAAGATAVLLLAAGLQVWADPVARHETHEAQLAKRFAAVTDDGTIYVRPEGASFVFLQRARRHVVPFPANDVGEVRARVADYRQRFGGGTRPARLVLAPGVTPPAALAHLPPAGERDGFRFFLVPD